jgi:hypothetical protein
MNGNCDSPREVHKNTTMSFFRNNIIHVAAREVVFDVLSFSRRTFVVTYGWEASLQYDVIQITQQNDKQRNRSEKVAQTEVSLKKQHLEHQNTVEQRTTDLALALSRKTALTPGRNCSKSTSLHNASSWLPRLFNASGLIASSNKLLLLFNAL